MPSQNPDLRRYDEAECDYDRYNATLQWNPGEAWSFVASFDTRKDDYSKSILGLTEDQYFNYNLEASFMVSEGATFYGFYQRSDRDSSMASRQSGATASLLAIDTWYADFEEANDLFGVGFNTKAGAWALDLSGRWAKSDGSLDFTATTGGLPLGSRAAAQDIPNYEDIELLVLSAKVDYQVQKHVKVGVYYRYEDYTIDSFIIQNLDDYLPGALLAGNRGDYTASIAGSWTPRSASESGAVSRPQPSPRREAGALFFSGATRRSTSRSFRARGGADLRTGRRRERGLPALAPQHGKTRVARERRVAVRKLTPEEATARRGDLAGMLAGGAASGHDRLVRIRRIGNQTNHPAVT